MSGRGEHTPGIKVEEGHQEVESNSRDGGDDQVGEHVVAEFDFRVLLRHLPDDDVDTCEYGICHDNSVDDHRR